ncbi:MAG: glycogen synthase [Verrucomicrobiota bacterium]|nr:glycogen synthase [Verrucomicrobiota bacterium]
MRIVQVAAEFAPFAKAGGLGEVIVGLSRELTRRGEQVDVILPKYDFILPHHLRQLQLEVPDFKTTESGKQVANAMWSAEAEHCRLHLLEARHPSGYFHRGKIYGCEDDIPRFLYFCRAVAEYLKLKKQPIDILHLHDWHVSALAPLIRDLFQKEVPVKAIVLTIHNIEYQGHCATHDLDAIGLKGERYLTPASLQDAVYPKSINLLKGGILYADSITAVSPTYAKEILTRANGFHLDATLRSVSHKLTGILNGIDYHLWNPASDAHLFAPYSHTDSLPKILEAKKANKHALEQRFGLSNSGRPWVGAVTRLVPQKGPELIEEGLRQTLPLGGSFALLGSTPSPKLQKHFESLKHQFEGHKQAFIQLTYDEALAHQLFAALDFLLVPSHFEPCGLTQLIAMRYGALPIVRATGGLKDTVFDCDDAMIPLSKRNGFSFLQATPQAMTATLQRALHFWRTDPTAVHATIQRVMQLDYGWQKPANEYLRLFKKILQ